MQTYTITYHIKGEPEHMRVSEDVTAPTLQAAEAMAGEKITANNVLYIVIPRNGELSTVVPWSSIAYASVERRKDTPEDNASAMPAMLTDDCTAKTVTVLPHEPTEEAELTLER
ncbi:MAG: hypothetical protein EOP06_14790 [Proteobacteria bacterium]|nr:MAG: hypothetical protein EOP06_14790 [Pseudomonadota bacterium]